MKITTLSSLSNQPHLDQFIQNFTDLFLTESTPLNKILKPTASTTIKRLQNLFLLNSQFFCIHLIFQITWVNRCKINSK